MIWIAIIAAAMLVDQLTKYVIKTNVDYGSMIPVIKNFFYITHHENTGAAWGIFQDGRYYFVFVTVILLSVLTYLFYKNDNKVFRISLSLILGGALGNFIDRIYKGAVVDFLDFYFGSYNFPTFNAADTFIVIGSVLLCYYVIFIYKEKEQTTNEEVK